MDETAMATMLLAGSFRRVKKKEKNGLSLFGVGEWVGGVVVLVG